MKRDPRPGDGVGQAGAVQGLLERPGALVQPGRNHELQSF